MYSSTSGKRSWVQISDMHPSMLITPCTGRGTWINTLQTTSGENSFLNSHNAFHPEMSKFFIIMIYVILQGTNYWTEFSRHLPVVVQTVSNRIWNILHLPTYYFIIRSQVSLWSRKNRFTRFSASYTCCHQTVMYPTYLIAGRKPDTTVVTTRRAQISNIPVE